MNKNLSSNFISSITEADWMKMIQTIGIFTFRNEHNMSKSNIFRKNIIKKKIIDHFENVIFNIFPEKYERNVHYDHQDHEPC